ncbi:MAG TPA: AP2/ERF family transcription factor, partial [Sedimentisphaerales bacterium]|nr:AP2/ERF family transcription factor [Sedimentisphaerales bacterium]
MTQDQARDTPCGRCCGNCRFALAVEYKGGSLLVCPYRHERRGRLAVVEPQEGCPEFRERVRPKEKPGQESCAIPLVNIDGLYALVDAADYEWLSRYTWRVVCTRGGAFYASTYWKGKWQFMHRMIMNPPAGMVVDHKNRYGLDNRRINLRNATPGQNNFNRAHNVGVSGFRGVHPYGDRWLAQIGHQYKALRLGVFDDPAEAARAYDRKAIELHGEFACLNFPEEA